MMLLKMEFVLAALILSCFHSFVLSDSQGDALYALKNSLNASSKQLMDWHPNEVDPCSWSNVVCDSSNNVISVTLSFMQLSGTLSPKIGILNTLSTLTLVGNGITGEIPEELGNLSNLTNLNLGNNRLTGEIPSSLGNLKKLRFLILNQNNLTGTIPESLSSLLPSLISLQLASNDLSSQIPEDLFQVPKHKY